MGSLGNLVMGHLQLSDKGLQWMVHKWGAIGSQNPKGEP